MKFLLSFFFLAFSIQTFLIGQEGAGKICLEGDRLFIVIPNFGFSIYNIKDPSRPKEIRFVECPGIADIAVRGEYIYTNRYEDLYLLKVPKDPTKNDTIIKFQINVFPSREVTTEPRTAINFFKDYKEFEEDLALFRDGGPAPMESVNGSMSSIALVGDYVYTVDSDKLRTYFGKPTALNVLANTATLEIPETTLETVWTPGDNRLYLGSRNGVYIVDATTRDNPKLLGTYRHTYSCDPVVVSGNIAYSTLRSGTECRRAVNVLDVIDISNPNAPVSLAKRPLTNPHGLAINGNLLTVCDGSDGLRIFDVSNPRQPLEISHPTGFMAYDVLFDGIKKVVFVSVPNELRIFSLQQPSQPAELSIISLPGSTP